MAMAKTTGRECASPSGGMKKAFLREQDTLNGRESGWARFDDCRSKPYAGDQTIGTKTEERRSDDCRAPE